jgi:hypothetical protein
MKLFIHLKNFKIALKKPNVTLKKLYLGTEIDGHLLGQIVKMFPDLMSLELKYFVSIHTKAL